MKMKGMAKKSSPKKPAGKAMAMKKAKPKAKGKMRGY